MARLVLSDTSPLIALSLIGRLDLLSALFGEITITDVVRAELLAGGDRPGQAAIASAVCEKLVRVIGESKKEPLFLFLDEGEASTLRAAIQHDGPCLVLIDERAGRAVAAEYGIAHTGTVGVILQAKKRALIPSARTVFAELLTQDFRIAAGLMREALARVGEE